MSLALNRSSAIPHFEHIDTTKIHVTSHCAERVGQGEVGGVTHRVLCTGQLLGLAIKEPWLALSGPIPTLAA